MIISCHPPVRGSRGLSRVREQRGSEEDVLLELQKGGIEPGVKLGQVRGKRSHSEMVLSVS